MAGVEGRQRPTHREPVEHHLQLDNKLPTIAPYPNGLQVYVNNPDGSQGTQVLACGTETTGASNSRSGASSTDAYYSRFSLRVVGGGPPTASAGFGPHSGGIRTTAPSAPIKNTN